MLLLSFPASVLVVLAFMAAGVALGHFGFGLPGSSRTEMISTWLLFALAGYIQWFIVIPAIPRAWKAWLNE
jgi:hypothetical protein